MDGTIRLQSTLDLGCGFFDAILMDIQLPADSDSTPQQLCPLGEREPLFLLAIHASRKHPERCLLAT